MVYDEDKITRAAREAAKRAYTARDEGRQANSEYWEGYRQALLDVVQDVLIEEDRVR